MTEEAKDTTEGAGEQLREEDVAAAIATAKGPAPGASAAVDSATTRTPPPLTELEILRQKHAAMKDRIQRIVALCEDPRYRGVSLGVRQVILLLDQIKEIAQRGV